jgi:hypothetical protein
MNKYGKILLAVAAAAVVTSSSRATGTSYDSITTLVTDGTTLFGAIVVLAASVTGFFLGRKWVKRI